MAGVALFAAIALLRIVHGFSLRRWLAIACSLMLALTLPAPADFVSPAHDAGSMTTGVLTTPVLLALAPGSSAMLAGRSAPLGRFRSPATGVGRADPVRPAAKMAHVMILAAALDRPWAGTTAGTEGLVQTFMDVFRFRSVVAFETQDRFENGDGAATFGCVTYRSNVPGMTVTSLHAILTRATGERLAFARFMEDSFAPARSFRESGTYRIRANPDDSSALDV